MSLPGYGLMFVPSEDSSAFFGWKKCRRGTISEVVSMHDGHERTWHAKQRLACLLDKSGKRRPDLKGAQQYRRHMAEHPRTPCAAKLTITRQESR